MAQSKKISVLDKGFVALVDHLGSDLSTVNAARISYGKQKEVFDEADEKLVKYLAEHHHQAPFRHAYVTFHIKAPIFVFRQLMKHQVGCTANELSMRYVDVTESDFYIPDVFRKQAVVNKQGSEGMVDDNVSAQLIYSVSCENSLEEYQKLLKLGVCREQARCVLPVSIYSEIFWTLSLQAAAHFVKLRKDSHAQWEIQQYALALEQFLLELYPVSYKHLVENL